VNDAECAEIVMRWTAENAVWHDKGHTRTTLDWLGADGKFVCTSQRFSPTTDRNATAMLVEEVARRGLEGEFTDYLYDEIPAPPGCTACGMKILRAAPSLVAWACCKACREAS